MRIFSINHIFILCCTTQTHYNQTINEKFIFPVIQFNYYILGDLPGIHWKAGNIPLKTGFYFMFIFKFILVTLLTITHK